LIACYWSATGQSSNLFCGIIIVMSDDAARFRKQAEECREQVTERTRSAERVLLGAPVVATDAGRIREYHDAILGAFAAPG